MMQAKMELKVILMNTMNLKSSESMIHTMTTTRMKKRQRKKRMRRMATNTKEKMLQIELKTIIGVN